MLCRRRFFFFRSIFILKKKQFSLAFWRWVKMENIRSFLFCQVLFLFVCCKADFSYSRCLIRSKPPFLSRLNEEQVSEMHTHHTTPNHEKKKISLCVIRLFNQKIYGSLFVAKVTNKCCPIYANRTAVMHVSLLLYICARHFTESNCILIVIACRKYTLEALTIALSKRFLKCYMILRRRAQCKTKRIRHKQMNNAYQIRVIWCTFNHRIYRYHPKTKKEKKSIPPWKMRNDFNSRKQMDL